MHKSWALPELGVLFKREAQDESRRKRKSEPKLALS
jgi:hypothetical protein